MKILHITASLDDRSGGPLRAMLDLSALAQPFGVTSEIAGVGQVVIHDNPICEEQIHAFPAKLSFGYSPSLRQWLTDNIQRFDGVILHGMWLYPTWIAAQICHRLGVPYISFPHGMLDRWPIYGQGTLKAFKKLAYWLLAERQIVKRSKCVFYTSHTERHNSREVFNIDAATALVVPYGYKPIAEIPSKPNRGDLDVLARGNYSLFLSRVHPKKNLELLIRCWAAAQLSSDWKLLIAGSGEPAYEASIGALIQKLNLQNQIHLVGHVSGDDKAFLLSRAKWFLLPSLQENFGIAVLEAITHSCPVAISDQVYFSEYLHSESEVLSLQEQDWVDFLRHRMTDLVWRDRLARLDEEAVASRFQSADIAAQWADQLRTVFQ